MAPLPRLLIFGGLLLVTIRAQAADVVTFKQDEAERQISGRVLVKASDGGLLVLAPDGVLWTVQPEELVSHTTDSSEFQPLSAGEVAARLVGELPDGFEVYSTNHYVLCHYTSRAYAEWCGALFERLYMAFTNYWKKRGFEIHEPEFPLVAVIFAERTSFGQFSQPELGPNSEQVIGYYSFRTNRMTMFDLTGIEELRRPNDRRGSAAQINLMLSRPEAERNVATIVHEATHQIAFNCGLSTRYSDVPLWISEGLAVYFETPDLSSKRGWKNIGGINRVRLERFAQYAQRRQAGSLESLIGDDARFRQTREALDAYAEAWALNYFLIRQHPKEYQAYMQGLAAKSPFVWNNPEERLAEFKAAFGDDLSRLDQEFLRYIGSQRE